MASRKAPSLSSLPRRWLMTDERGGDPVAIARGLPKGAGIIFRHHATPTTERQILFTQVRRVARARRLVLLLAGTPARARAWGAEGAHHRSLRVSNGLRTMAVHNRRELVVAKRGRADLILVSPVFATASHPGKAPLGIARFGLLIGAQRHRTIALGGIDVKSYKKLVEMRIHGWAAIDAFKPG